MASVDDIVEGLLILKRYARDGAHIGGAGHDIIHGPELARPLLMPDEHRLEELGWHVDEWSNLWSRFC